MISRGDSILHLLPAKTRHVYIRNHFSISRHQILCANGIFYLPDVVIDTTRVGVTKQARRVIKQYGRYVIDPTTSPVAVSLMWKVILIIFSNLLLVKLCDLTTRITNVLCVFNQI